MSVQAYIKGLGFYVPERILTNDELSGMVDTNDEWIRSRTGIAERHLAAPNQLCSDLALEASQKALKSAGMKASELTAIIHATVTGDAIFPATSAFLQHKLGAAHGMAVDISAACSGFVYGLQLAQGLAAVNPDAKILVSAAEVLSHRVNWQDRGTCVLFGDGAGAAIVTGSKENKGANPMFANGLIEGVLCDADGSLTGLLGAEGGAAAHPYKEGDTVGSEYFIHMQGREVFKHAVRSMSKICDTLLEKLGYSIEDIDILLPHQANLRIIEAVGQRLNMPTEKVFINVDRYGNTSAASIPLALAEAVETGAIKPGMRVLLTTFGAGLTWAAAVIKF